MRDDLKQAIDRARQAVKGVPSRTLLGRSLYRALDLAELAYRCGDAKAVREELNAINQLLTQN